MLWCPFTQFPHPCPHPSFCRGCGGGGGMVCSVSSALDFDLFALQLAVLIITMMT